jgi:hypothetical protein
MKRPRFSAAWRASQRIFDPANSSARVASVIGGAVASNVTSGEHPWRNTCAVRISYILNYTGIYVPSLHTETVPGADHRHYFFRVKDVMKFLRRQWGPPDIVVKFPPVGGGPLAGKRGLILFEVKGWNDAAGHATLWNGTQCYDHCYFNESGVSYKTERANFWSLR